MAWGQDKTEFIRRRDQLLELASHGETDVYKAIVADWVTVWPAGTTMGRAASGRIP